MHILLVAEQRSCCWTCPRWASELEHNGWYISILIEFLCIRNWQCGTDTSTMKSYLRSINWHVRQRPTLIGHSSDTHMDFWIMSLITYTILFCVRHLLYTSWTRPTSHILSFVHMPCLLCYLLSFIHETIYTIEKVVKIMTCITCFNIHLATP